MFSCGRTWPAIIGQGYSAATPRLLRTKPGLLSSDIGLPLTSRFTRSVESFRASERTNRTVPLLVIEGGDSVKDVRLAFVVELALLEGVV